MSSTKANTRDYSGAYAHPIVPVVILAEPSPPPTLIRASQIALSDAFAFTGPNTHSGAEAFASINNRIFADQQAGADACAKILTAYGSSAVPAALPVTGGQVFADSFQGVQTCAVNPLPTVSKSGTLWLGNAQFRTTASWILRNKMNLTGSGRGDTSNNTYIKAFAGFPVSTPVIQFDTAGPVFDIIVSKLGVDCGNIAGAIGIQDTNGQEQSSAREVDIVDCPAIGLDVESAGQNSGPWEKLEVLYTPACANCGAGTIGIKINPGGSPFRGVRGVTVNATGTGFVVGTGVQALTDGVYEDIHCETVTVCVDVTTQGAVVRNIQCSASVTTCVRLNAGSQHVTVSGVSGGSTNLLIDSMNSITLTAAAEGMVGWYITGASGAAPGQCSSSRNVICNAMFGKSAVPILDNTSDLGTAFPAWRNIFTYIASFIEGTAPAAAGGIDKCYGDSTAHALECSYNSGTFFQIPQVIKATSAAFATATTAATCVQNTTAVTGATTAMAVTISPVSTPGVGAQWSAFVSSAGNVTINECAVAASAGGSIAFNIRVTP